MSETKIKNPYDRVATSEEIRQISRKSDDDLAKFFGESHAIHDNATLLAVVNGVAYPIYEIADNH